MAVSKGLHVEHNLEQLKSIGYVDKGWGTVIKCFSATGKRNIYYDSRTGEFFYNGKGVKREYSKLNFILLGFI